LGLGIGLGLELGLGGPWEWRTPGMADGTVMGAALNGVIFDDLE